MCSHKPDVECVMCFASIDTEEDRFCICEYCEEFICFKCKDEYITTTLGLGRYRFCSSDCAKLHVRENSDYYFI